LELEVHQARHHDQVLKVHKGFFLACWRQVLRVRKVRMSGMAGLQQVLRVRKEGIDLRLELAQM
jgi:alkylated DNA nucleotide flippase Atl1